MFGYTAREPPPTVPSGCGLCGPAELNGAAQGFLGPAQVASSPRGEYMDGSLTQ